MSTINDRRLAPASEIVDKFRQGRRTGVSVIAEITGLRPAAIYRWMYAKENGGTGGLVPQRWHRDLLRDARARSIPLNPNDFVGVYHLDAEGAEAPASIPA